MSYLLLILGFILLLSSGHFLVNASSVIANRLGLPKIVIGLLIVSFGTSIPELLVSLQAALRGHPEMSMGNVIGSNIANIALVLGLTAIILPIAVKNKLIWADWLVMMLGSLLLLLFSYTANTLEQWEGFVFIGISCSYIFISLRYRKTENDIENIEKTKGNLISSLILLIVSIVGMYFGADLLIDNASFIATSWGVSESVISVTIIAFGTSVPELATSVIAALKKEMDISIGNIIGSNIFNILSILGITSAICPIEINPTIIQKDILWMITISIGLFISIIPLSKARIGRGKGVLLLLFYCAYIFIQF